MISEHARMARIKARIAPDVLSLVKQAAEMQGRSVSDFVVSAAQEAAHRAIEEAQIIRLSAEDQRRFVELLRLGGALLWDAMSRASRSEMEIFALAVDAKDHQAEAFYRHHGFVGFGSAPRQLFLPLDKDSGMR